MGKVYVLHEILVFGEMLNYVHSFLSALVVTVGIETTVLFLLVRMYWKREHFNFGNGKLFFSGILASFATIPYVWLVFPVLLYHDRGIALLYGEVSAFFVEAVIYFFVLDISMKRALAISLICNAVSFSFGKFLF